MSDLFERALGAYENEDYFEAHEHFEAVWLVERDPARKRGLQGLVLIAVAMHKIAAQKKALVGARLFRRAIERFGVGPPILEGIAVEPLCAILAHLASELERGESISAPPLVSGPSAPR